ncbi:DUF2142 domain-containing protein [Bifidobacterium leontopitheci]|uniref:DUF2142 domain-containing protein n=1 Tax=Bifidobacterium leontopitheci TaxID=2650774 RepID=A0A6I1GIC6_9BIFI|nr:DUF2142 domain-containing protein [Bifidobacterium leontopitheci]KAB7791434.1 hypothetical protein F7D09_0109 [Bifidobacterium leontopitheci]
MTRTLRRLRHPSARFDRLLPWLAAAVIALTGIVMIAVTPTGHIPDVWAHTYRVSGILNGDVLARPVSAHSRLHSGEGTVGGCVGRDWIVFSIEHDDGYDPSAVSADVLSAAGTRPDSAASDTATSDTATSDTATSSPAQSTRCLDVPYNNAAVNSPAAYLPQLAAFALGDALELDAGVTYVLAESFMLTVYVCCMFAALAALPRWRLPVATVMVCPLMTYRYAFAVSADSMAQAMCLLYSCLLYAHIARTQDARRHHDGDERHEGAPGNRDGGIGMTVALMASGLLMVAAKFTMAPLLALSLFTLPKSGSIRPGRSHPDSTARSVLVILGNAAGAAFLAVWMRLTSWFTTTPGVVSYETMMERKRLLFADPFGANGVFGAAAAIVRAVVTAKSNLDSPMQSMLIRALWLLTAAVLAVLLVAMARRRLGRFMSLFWWCACAACVAAILLTYLALWLQYTPQDATVVRGFQFRYMLPFAGLLTLCACDCMVGTVRQSHHNPA